MLQSFGPFSLHRGRDEYLVLRYAKDPRHRANDGRLTSTTGSEYLAAMVDDDELRGLGGWLWFVAIGLVIQPFRILLYARTYYTPMFSEGSWEVLTSPDSDMYHPWWGPLIVGDMVSDVMLAVLWLYLLYLFFSKHRWFPRVYIASLLVTLILQVASGQFLLTMLPDEPMDPEATKDIVRTAFNCVIWIPYMLVSKRVKSTFVENSRHAAVLAFAGASVALGVPGVLSIVPEVPEPWAAQSMEQRLETLAACGVRLLPERTSDELLISFEREEYESDDALLLAMLGGQVEGEPWGRRFSEDIWYLDTECIDRDGAYVRIAERVMALAGGSLPLEHLRDHVDLDGGVAWLEFRLNGFDYHWDAEVEDDWLDPKIMSNFAELVAGRSTGSRLTHIDLGGQDCLIGMASTKELLCLDSRTTLDVVWLE